MKKVIALLLVLAMMLGLAACGECDHEWEDATCEDPKTCSKCGETKGDPEDEHDWEEDDDGMLVCSWCGEEKDESDDEDEDKDEDEESSIQAPTAPTAAGVSWNCTAINGLTYYIPEGIPETERSDDFVHYSDGDMEIMVVGGALDGMASDATEFAEMYMDEMSESYDSMELDRSNGVPYTFSTVTDGVYEVCGYYVYNDYGFMIITYFYDLDSYGDIAIRCVTTGQIDESFVPEGNQPDDVETESETFTVHAYVPAAWGYPSCWAWSSTTGENVFDAWPGEQMYWTGDHYTIEIPTWADYVIVNGVDGAVQTADEPVEPGCDIWILIYPEGDFYGVSYSEPTAEEFSEAGY